ncbi:MAG: carbonic anhydrase [Dehalococcoidia bacterium]
MDTLDRPNRRGASRRTFLAAAMASVAGIVGGKALRPAGATPENLTPEEAFRRLLEGNYRYVNGLPSQADRSAGRRAEVARGQKPIAAVLGCADSRVPPEAVFDQGLGDLFVLRVAGNIADPAVIGSIEYGVEEFGIPLIVVLGHERCGAVEATLDALATGAEPPGQIGAVIEPIRKPAQLARLRAHLAGLAPTPTAEMDVLDAAIRANVANVVDVLRNSQPFLFPLIQRNKLRVVGLRYDLETGGTEIVA